jgi:Flp pilus assembly protein TadD
MFPSLARPALAPRRFAAVLCAALATAALGGCKSAGDVTGSINAAAPLPGDPSRLHARVEELGRRYESKPGDAALAMDYAAGLRAEERNAQAVAVLQNAVARNPSNLSLLAAFGKALADAGRLKEADAALERAHMPERPNWSVLSAQGSVADQLGEHERARRLYDAALKIAPGEPVVLSNLGLSYALSRDLPRAEATLRQANRHPRADARMRQNLALVLALSGKYQEAEEVARRDLSPADAAANIAAIRKTIVENDTWRKIQAVGSGEAGKRRS